jgi:glycosyltransferase involved in cell wall biosynthesis
VSASAPARSSTRSSASSGTAVRVLAFGTYQRDYPRNAQVRSCLRAAGVDVSERHVSVWDDARDAWAAGPLRLTRLAAAELRLAATRNADADAVLVGYPGHLDLDAARRAARGRPVVFDPLVSLHDTLVGDRGRFRLHSPAARVLQAVDRRAFGLADVVVADTAAHAAFYRERFGLAGDRVRVCFVGAEDRLFRPGASPDGPFHALFVGKLIPLHGLETILAAARLVPDIPFRVVGSGQLEWQLAAAPANVKHVPWVDYEQLPAELHAAGCALGIFGTSAKASRVIPNKAYQALACGVPLITADTPASRELLTHGEDALLVPAGDARVIADAVRLLASDGVLAARIGNSGRLTYERYAGEPVLGRAWRTVFEDVAG